MVTHERLAAELTRFLFLTLLVACASDDPVESKPQGQSAESKNNDAGSSAAHGQCKDDHDCAVNPRLHCVASKQASASDSRTLKLPVIDSLQLKPLPEVPIRACDTSDNKCMQPVASVDSDSDGIALLTVPANFSGYMQQTERSDYVPALYFMPARWSADGRLSNFPLVATSVFSGLALALGTTLDTARGHAMLIIEDCLGTALSGISFESPQADAASTQFYLRDQLPTSTATETPAEGTGGYVNLPAGPIEITATDNKTGLALNTIKALIRAGSITTIYIHPAARDSE